MQKSKKFDINNFQGNIEHSFKVQSNTGNLGRIYIANEDRIVTTCSSSIQILNKKFEII
jgi:hypothetical protein